MCGIVGIVNLDGGPIDARVVSDMAEALRHRGPDGDGDLVDGRVALAHTRLAIIDVDGGAQPMTCGDCTVVFNGEICNYEELREELRARGHRFRTTSDTEVLLRMYAEHGVDAIPRLNGMFAFLLWDRARRRLVAARDHFGIKPLYYRRSPAHLLFASEIKALLRHPDVRAEPDRDALADYLTFQFVLGEGTMFAGVRKVLPGQYHVVDVDSGATRVVQYWEPHFAVDEDHTETYFVQRLRRLLEDAVRLQTRSDVPVGAYLSGGMDSGIVSTLAARHVTSLQCFTGRFAEGPEFDESAYAREAAAALGVPLHETVPTECDFVDLLPTLVYHMDEPAGGPGLFPQYAVSRLAAQHVKVVLGGQGGDEMFGGYARYLVAYFEQALKGAIQGTNEEREHIVSLASIIPTLPVLRQYVPMLRQFWAAEVFEPMDRRYFRLVDRSGGSLCLYSADYRAAHRPDETFERFQRIFNRPDTLSYYNKMTSFDFAAGLPALLQVEDRVSMACGLEARVPLLDRRIVDLVASMPPRMKFRGGELKYALKRAAGDLVPRSILERKDKMGFPVPLHLWARGRAREFFRDVLLSQRSRERGLFDTVAVSQLLDREAAFGRRLWGLLNLELWFRRFVDAA